MTDNTAGTDKTFAHAQQLGRAGDLLFGLGVFALIVGIVGYMITGSVEWVVLVMPSLLSTYGAIFLNRKATRIFNGLCRAADTQI